MTRRTAVDPELMEQCRRFEPVLQVSPSAIVITDPSATVVAWNEPAEKLFGYTAEEAIGRNLDDLVAKNDEIHAEAVGFSERAPLERFQAITRRTRKDGSLVDVNLLLAPVVVDGRSLGAFTVYHDITEIGRDQQRLFESLVEVSPEAIVTTDMGDVVRSWNPAAERLFGYSAEEAIGRHVDDLVCAREDLRAEGEELDRQANQGQAVRAVTQRTRKDGSLVDVDVVGGPVTVRGQIVAKHVIYHDITELQQQKLYFQSLLEISPTAIVVTGLDSNIISWNPAAERLFGYSSEEAVGRNLDDLVATRPELHRE
ncbi:MAG: PAS domain S-box protein, partial [Actinomycetota bacterium]